VQTRNYGVASVSSTVRMLRKVKVKASDVVGVAGALLVSQDDAQDMAGLARAWTSVYCGSGSSRDSGTSTSGVKSPGVWEGIYSKCKYRQGAT
jgi:hypothetical protein